MLIACSRESDAAGDACLVVIGRGCKVEAFVLYDNGCRIEHVADWHLDSVVLAVSVAPVEGKGFLVTSACEIGVGWSWIENINWTVVSTQFQDIIAHHRGSKRVEEAATNSRQEANDSADESNHTLKVNMRRGCGAVVYLSHAAVLLVSLNHKVFLSCIITTFNQTLRISTSLCFATELGYASAGRAAAPHMHLTLASFDRSHVATTTTALGGAADVRGSSLGAGLNRNENNSTIVIKKMRAVSDLNDTVVLECHDSFGGPTRLRWCELEGEHVPDADVEDKDKDLMLWGGAAEMHTHAGRAFLSHKKNTLKSDFVDKEGGGVLRVIWEINLKAGSCWCTEPYNNDGMDSRKLLYVAVPEGHIFVYNVNGLMCRYTVTPAVGSDDSFGVWPHGNIIGIMVQPLPLTDECRRLVIASTANGQYIECQLDDVSCSEEPSDDSECPVYHYASVRSMDVAVAVEQPYNGVPLIFSPEESSRPIIPYASAMFPCSPPEGELAIFTSASLRAFLGFHESFGVQLLSALSGYATASENNKILGTATKLEDEDDTSMAPLIPLQPYRCFTSSSLCRLTDVRLVQEMRGCIHNSSIPDKLVACCTNDVASWVDSVSQTTAQAATRSILYACDYGAGVVTHADVEVDIPAEFLAGLRLLSVSYAQMYGLAAASIRLQANIPKSGAKADGCVLDDDDDSGTKDRFWPVVVSSRTLNQSGVIVLNVSKNSVVDEVPGYMEVIQDQPTVALLPIAGNGIRHSGLAVQIVKNRLKLIYLEERPDIINQYTCVLKKETTLADIDSENASLPLPPDTLSGPSSVVDDGIVESDNDSEITTTSDDEPDLDEALMGDEDDCEIRSTDSDHTRNVKGREQKRRARATRARLRAEQEVALTSREKDKLKMLLAREHRIRERERESIHPQEPWNIELAGSLGDCIALAGKGQVSVVQLKPASIRVQPTAPTGQASSAARPTLSARQSVRVKMVGEQVPFVLKYKLRLPGSISAMGTLLWQGQRVIACSYWGQNVVDIYKCPDDFNPPLPATVAEAEASASAAVTGLEKVAIIDLSAFKRSSTGTDRSTSKNQSSDGLDVNALLIKHLVLLPLGSSNEVEATDLRNGHPTSVTSPSSDGRVSSADKLRSEIVAAKRDESTRAPILSVFAVIAATMSGDILVYYVHMRQNKDLSVRLWEVSFHKQFSTRRRIVNLMGLDSRQTNMVTRPDKRTENHKDGHPDTNKETNGSALLVHVHDAHYLLHFTSGGSSDDLLSDTYKGKDDTGHVANSLSSTDGISDVTMNVGAIYEGADEMQYDTGGDDKTSKAVEKNKVEKDTPDSARGNHKKDKRRKRVLGIRQVLINEVEVELAAAVARGKVATSCLPSRRSHLPRDIRDHCWTWTPLLFKSYKGASGSIAQIPGCGAGGGYRKSTEEQDPTRRLLNDLGFSWLMPSPVDTNLTSDTTKTQNDRDDAEGGDTFDNGENHSSGSGAGSLLCIGAPSDQPVRFYQHTFSAMPGKVISMTANRNRSKIIVAWQGLPDRVHLTADTKFTGESQGICVLDAKTLYCYWSFAYPRWDGMGSIGPPIAPLSIHPEADTEQSTSNEAGPLHATRSSRAAAARLVEARNSRTSLWKRAISSSLESLLKTAAFTSSPSGHRELLQVLRGLPPWVAEKNMQMPDATDGFLALHRTTLSLNFDSDSQSAFTREGLPCLPNTAQCILVSAFALVSDKSSNTKQQRGLGSHGDGNSEDPVTLRSVGTFGYYYEGNVVATTVDTSSFSKSFHSNTYDNFVSPTDDDSPKQISAQSPRYLILACDNDISVIGWQICSPQNTQSPRAGTSPKSKLKLGRICHLSHNWGRAVQISSGAAVGTSCKVFLSCVTDQGNNQRHLNTARAVYTTSVQILTLSRDSMHSVSIALERTIHLPCGPLSYAIPGSILTLDDVHSGAAYSLKYAIPERFVGVSGVDLTTSQVITACCRVTDGASTCESTHSGKKQTFDNQTFKPSQDTSDDEDCRPYTKSTGTPRHDNRADEDAVATIDNVLASKFTRIMEVEAFQDKRNTLPMHSAQVTISSKPLPQGLLSSEVISYNAVAAVQSDPAHDHRTVGMLWGLLDSDLDFHVRSDMSKVA